MLSRDLRRSHAVTSILNETATAAEQAALEQLYDDFAAAHLAPLWTQRAGLMPDQPRPAAVPARRAQRRAGTGGAGRRASRHRPGEPGTTRYRVRHADVVGRDPVPRSW